MPCKDAPSSSPGRTSNKKVLAKGIATRSKDNSVQLARWVLQLDWTPQASELSTHLSRYKCRGWACTCATSILALAPQVSHWTGSGLFNSESGHRALDVDY